MMPLFSGLCRINEKNIRCYLFTCLIFFVAPPLKAQVKAKDENPDSLVYCKPGLANSPRPKFFELSRTSSYFHNARANNYLTESEERKRVVSNDRFEAKLKFPLWMHPGFNMFGGIGYSSETYSFAKSGSQRGDSGFLSNIDEQTLKGVSAKIYATKPFKSNKFLFAKVGIKFQGDFHETHSPVNSYLNYDAGLLYGWKSSEDFVMGAGIAASNNFGRFSIYPIFVYQRNFTNRISLEALLPASIKVRYTTFDSRNIIYGVSEVNGSNYRINQPEILPGANGAIVWQNANVDVKLGYEREIHDWLWFTLEAGIRQNLRSRIRYPEADGQEVILDCNWDQSMVFKAGIFFVPPRKLLNRH
ncbi:DUF6268 family outer membrane beta-barrel protein [Roseivirga sp. BDSF3-8]|uniref:DUF6268 family outer membrane beta-barrel protein n=1 Tax=Roseivirga sp. BDSF3-8 TaxID=3241598 RepID=UPI003531F8C9